MSSQMNWPPRGAVTLIFPSCQYYLTVHSGWCGILHALKCVLGAPEALFFLCMHTVHIYVNFNTCVIYNIVTFGYFLVFGQLKCDACLLAAQSVLPMHMLCCTSIHLKYQSLVHNNMNYSIHSVVVLDPVLSDAVHRRGEPHLTQLSWQQLMERYIDTNYSHYPNVHLSSVFTSNILNGKTICCKYSARECSSFVLLSMDELGMLDQDK